MPRIPAEQISPYDQRLVPARGVASRYGIHLRSIARWVARGVIPPPDQVICDRRYWCVETLDQADRRRTIEAGAKGGKPASLKSKTAAKVEPAAAYLSPGAGRQSV